LELTKIILAARHAVRQGVSITDDKMSLLRTSKDKERYYLFAGMGGHAARRKKNVFLAWSLVVGSLVAAVLAVIFIALNR
jgi:hypothetical protein